MSRPPRTIAALVRHGDYHQLPDTPSAHQPFPLTERGEAQAAAAGHAVASTLAAEGWRLDETIDASQLLRAWQTAEGLREVLREVGYQAATGGSELRVESVVALAERGLGSAANLSLEQIARAVEADPRCEALPVDWKSNSHFCLPLPGAESLMEAGERVAEHLESRMAALAARAGQDTLKLFIGHGAAFRHAAHRLGVLAFDDIARLSMYHAVPVYLERDAQGRWRHIGGCWKVRAGAADDRD
ncbi:histidine phosphatase family protein [Halomonas sp. THAF12]|uniref:histidine phosphatase family protein n=1 Tax=Halomonas sp. B23F22_10 TaxID=3459515 RepID=UPI00373E45BE